METNLNASKWKIAFNLFLLVFSFIIVISSMLNLIDTDRNVLYIIVGLTIASGSVFRLLRMRGETKTKF